MTSEDIRLIHDDCLHAMADMPNESVDFVFTGCPWGYSDEGSITAKGREFARQLLDDATAQCKRLLKPGGFFVNETPGGSSTHTLDWLNTVCKHLEWEQLVIWDRRSMGMGMHYRQQYETFLVARKPGKPIKWYDTTHTVRSILTVKRPVINDATHTAPIPPSVPAFFMRLHSQPGDVVMDPFMGNGPTGVACVLTGRKFIGIELEARYYWNAQLRIKQAQEQPDYEELA